MADTSNSNEPSWWQWLGNTAAAVYTQKLNSKVQIAQNNAVLAAMQDNETLSFLGYDVHKKTLLWIGGGLIITALMLAVLRRR